MKAKLLEVRTKYILYFMLRHNCDCECVTINRISALNNAIHKTTSRYEK